MRYTRSLMLIVALLGVSCSSSSDEPSVGDSADSTTTIAATLFDDGATGLTGVAGELAEILGTNDGRFPLPDAVDLFASTYGEIPGGDAARFAGHAGDGTVALMAVGAIWEQLTAEQQQAIQVLLGYSSAQPLLTPPASADEIALQAMIDSARSEIAGLVGTDVSFPITGELVSLPEVDGEPVLGQTLSERGGVWVASGEVDRCRIQFNSDYPFTETTVAHEVFHCFGFELAPDLAAAYRAQMWVIEGSAEWAGAKVGGVDSGAVTSFREWRANQGSLFGLSYSAIGYYWVLESMGVSPWLVIDDMLATSGIDAVAASGRDPAAVLNRVATSLARSTLAPTLPVSAVWDFAVEDVPDGGSRTPITVTPELPFEAAYGRGSFAHMPEGVVTLEGGERVAVSIESDVGTLEFFGQDAIEWRGSVRQEFCLEEGGCACGLDGEVESGLRQGARELVLTGGELEAGDVNVSVRIPEPSGSFTDGHWTGTITSTALVITGGATTATRHENITAIEFTVANGAITAGSYGFGSYAEIVIPNGLTSQGILTVTGVFAGCGFSPQMLGTGYTFDGVMTVGDNPEVPLRFDQPIDGQLAFGGTVWVIDPVTDPNRRTGELDPSGDLAVLGSLGIAANDIVITFEATLTG